MNEVALDPVKVAAPWMDERSHNMLREFFRVGCKARCVLVEPDRAQAVLIDVDRGDATRRLHEARQRWPNAPVIELSVNYTDQALFVRKPLRPKGMTRALLSVRRRLKLSEDPVVTSVSESRTEYATAPTTDFKPRGPVPQPGTEAHFVGQGANLAREAPDTWTRGLYDPAQYLQGFLQKAVELAESSGQGVDLSGVWGCWRIPPTNGPIDIAMPDHHLRSLCVVDMSEKEIRMTLADDSEPLTCLAEQISRDAFIWKVTLMTARGRLPLGTPLDAPVFLRHWPDLNELLVTPDAMRIAALWLNHPIDLISLAERLDIPQRHVFSFYSACHALRLAGPAKRASDNLVEAPQLDTRGMRGLINRLGEKLRLGTQAESA